MVRVAVIVATVVAVLVDVGLASSRLYDSFFIGSNYWALSSGVPCERPFYVFLSSFSAFLDFRWSTFNGCQTKECKLMFK